MAKVTKKNETEPKEKKASFFDCLNEIEGSQRPWEELPEDVQKAYSQFMINRFISSKKNYAGAIALITSHPVSNEVHYAYCCSFVNKQKHYFDYKAYKSAAKVADELAIYALVHQYEISAREAEDYYASLMDERHIGGAEEVEELKAKWKLHYDTFGKNK